MIDEQPEKVALGRRHEPVKHMRILAHRQMSKNPDRLPGRWQFVVTRKRNKDFVPDAADIDNRLGRQGIYEFAVKKGDHGNRYIVKRSYSGFSTSVRSTRFPFAVLKPLVEKNFQCCGEFAKSVPATGVCRMIKRGPDMLMNSVARRLFNGVRNPFTRERKYQTRLGSSNSTEANCMFRCKEACDS